MALGVAVLDGPVEVVPLEYEPPLDDDPPEPLPPQHPPLPPAALIEKVTVALVVFALTYGPRCPLQETLILCCPDAGLS